MILFWAAALAFIILLYVVLDGFDLGVGILFCFIKDESHRQKLVSSIAPVWDGNETWLILTAAVLFGAFPRVYATVLQAFYMPMIVLLAALILRGVAFEFREKTIRMRWLWDIGFGYGSAVAAFIQGLTVGALVQGISMTNGQYSGGSLSWLSPFSCLCGIGLCLGYSLLGASWLVAKTEGSIRDRAYATMPFLLAAVLVFLAVVFGCASLENLRIIARWEERPYLFVFPAIGALATLGLIAAVKSRSDFWPFRMTALIFLMAFGTLAVSFWPYMIPFSITIFEAASPESSLVFMFWGAGFVVLPLTVIHTAAVYRMFQGKITERPGHY